MVVMSAPSRGPTICKHDTTDRPSTITVHAPQSPVRHPHFVPLRWSCPRRYRQQGVTRIDRLDHWIAVDGDADPHVGAPGGAAAGARPLTGASPPGHSPAALAWAIERALAASTPATWRRCSAVPRVSLIGSHAADTAALTASSRSVVSGAPASSDSSPGTSTAVGATAPSASLNLLHGRLSALTVGAYPCGDANSGEIHRPADRLAQIARAATGRNPQAHAREDLASRQDRGPGSGGQGGYSLPTLAAGTQDRGRQRRGRSAAAPSRRLVRRCRGCRPSVAMLRICTEPRTLAASARAEARTMTAGSASIAPMAAAAPMCSSVAVPAHAPEFVYSGHVH